MYVVWLSPGGFGGFTGIFQDAEICPGFPPPKAALVTVASGEKGLWVVWCNSDEDRFKGQERENLNDGNTTIKLRLRFVVGTVVRSFGSGGGDTLTRG